MDLDRVDAACGCLKALAHPLRLGILCLLSEGEQSVQAIATALSASQPHISINLKKMKDQGLLESRKQKTQVLYCIRDARLLQLLLLLKDMYCPDAPPTTEPSPL